MNNKIHQSLLITLLIAGQAYGMDRPPLVLYQSLSDTSHAGNCANYPVNAGPLETELATLSQRLNNNAKTIALAAKQQAVSNKASSLVFPVITGLVNGVLDIHKAAFVDQQRFWQPASGALCNAVLGLGCLLYAIISHQNARAQGGHLAELSSDQMETWRKHDTLFKDLYHNETHLVGERNKTRGELVHASAGSIAKTIFQQQLKSAYISAGQEEAQRAGLYCLLALCGYNVAKDGYFLTFMDSDPAYSLTKCSMLLNAAGFTSAGALSVSSLYRSTQKEHTIQGLLSTLDALDNE